MPNRQVTSIQSCSRHACSDFYLEFYELWRWALGVKDCLEGLWDHVKQAARLVDVWGFRQMTQALSIEGAVRTGVACDL